MTRSAAGGLRKSEMPDYGKPILRILLPVLISIFAVLFLISFACRKESDNCREGKLDIITRAFHIKVEENSFKIYNYQTMTSNGSGILLTTEAPVDNQTAEGEGSFWDKNGSAIIYACLFIVLLATLTFFIFLVLYYQMHFLIYIYFGLVIFFGMTFLTMIFINQFSKVINISFDLYSVIFFIYNVNMLGYCIFKKTDENSSKTARKGYGIYLSILVSSFSVVFIPTFACVAFLVLIVLWDLFAVLTPFGPLKLILNLMNERERNPDNKDRTPGNISELMLFSTMVSNQETTVQVVKQTKEPEVKPGTANSKKLIPLNADGSLDPRADRHVRKFGSGNCIFVQKDLETMAEIRPQLGMGDFIFYNLFICKFSLISDSWFFIMACILSVIFGLIVTLFILIVLDMALPALPIPIAFGLVTALFMLVIGGMDMLEQCNGSLIFI